MRWRLSGGLQRWTAIAVGVAMVATVVVLAIGRDGFTETRVALNDAGIWVTSRQKQAVGRVNTQIQEIEVRFKIAPDADVVQVDEAVVLHDPGESQMVVVDVAAAQPREGQPLPREARPMLGGPNGAVADPASGKVWVVPRAEMGTIDVKQMDPTATFGKGIVSAMGTDGVLHAFDAAKGQVHHVGPDGAVETDDVGKGFAAPQITAVGSRAVVADARSGRVQVVGGSSATVPGEGTRLQQPGPDADGVLLATHDELVEIDLDGGGTEVIDGGGTGTPAAPVFLEGCAYGAWSEQPRYAFRCADGRELAREIESMGESADLTFRVNRKRVVLNDKATGNNLLFTDEEPVPVDDWTKAESREQEPNEERKITERPKEECPDEFERPEGVPDIAGTRPGRPVIVPVLENDGSNQCDVLLVELIEQMPADVGTVAVVEAGTAVQVTPAPSRTEDIVVPYRVRGRDGEDESDLTVTIAADGTNRPPVAELDKTVVDAGKTVRHNVLLNDRDPDGDAITLASATVENGSLQFQADGQIEYTAAGDGSGVQNLTYVVRDEFNEEDTGTLEIVVSPPDVNSAPTARSDRLVAFVGKEARVDLLANDTDPNSDPLSISRVDAPSALAADWDPSGELAVTPTQPGTFQFTYEVSDNEAAVIGQVRVDVLEPTENTPPVAVRDELVVRPGVPAYVDLVANDIDLDGDVLAVTAVQPEGSDLAVELLEMRTARVTASVGLARSTVVRYWVSDGGDPVPGVLVVRPLLIAGQDQPPITSPDAVVVRAGNTVGVEVLRNDIDPEGEVLRLIEVDEMQPDQGDVFRQGDELRYRAPDGGNGQFFTNYTVVDPAGNRRSGEVTFRVIPEESDNQAPNAPVLDARVFSGESVTVQVPLLGADPDGDPVALMGLTAAPSKGTATFSANAIQYTADRGATGADELRFLLRDSGGLTAIGRLRIVVAPKPSENSAPVGVPDRIVLKVGEERTIPVLANDVDLDGDALTLLEGDVEGPSTPGLGTVVRLTDDKTGIVYRAPTQIDQEVVQDSFTYGLVDAGSASARGLVTVTIQRADPANQPPIARDDVAKPTLAGKRISIDVLANDTDPDDPGGELTVEVLGRTDVEVNGGTVSIVAPDRSVTFIYEVTDARDGKARAVVQIPVVDALPPIANPDALELDAGDAETLDVLENDEDPGGGDLTLVRVVGARGGRADIVDEDGTVEFTAAPDASGGAGFAYVVTNGQLEAVGFVAVTVNGRDFPPTFQGTPVSMPAGGSRAVDLTRLVEDLNPDDEHTFSDVSSSDGKVSADLSGSVLNLEATDDAKGTQATVSLKVSDGANTIDGQISVTVTGNEGPPPVAVDDVAQTTQGKAKTINVTANDADPLGEGLTVEVLSQQGGTATLEGTDSIRFTPTSTFFGTALVTYRILDASKEEERASTATVRITVFGFPGKPPAPAGRSGESRLVRLTWGVPAANGAPIQSYVIETNTGIRQESGTNSHVFTGLTNGERYRFRVAARNEAVTNDGELVWSDYSPEIIPDTKPGAPAAPTLKYGDKYIDLTWTPPTNEGSQLTGYTLRASPSPSGGPTVQVGANTRTYRWQGLTNGTAYSFEVMATNAAGDSPWGAPSNRSDPNATPAGRPFAPTNVSAQRSDTLNGADNTQAGGVVTVTWSWDDGAQGNGDPAAEFQITASPGGATRTVPGSARSVDMTGLSNGTSYTFAVRARNKTFSTSGWGDPGTSGAATPARVPGQVSSVSASEGDEEAPLTFSAPDSGGEAITRYEAQSNQGAVTLAQGGGGVTQTGGYRATGLSNGTSYTFQVRACNVVGCGAWSPSSNAVVPFGDPARPSVSASVNDRTITWTWNEPSGNGRPISHYEVRLDGNLVDGNYTGRSFQRTFGYSESHSVSVIAVNTGGRKSSAGSDSARTADPPRSVSISKGSSAVGQSTPGYGTCTSSSCAYIRVNTEGLGSGRHEYYCHSNVNGEFWGPSYASGTSFQTTCYYGFPGHKVWVVVDGVKSNEITW